jgi:hypothetical protein
MVNEWIDWIEKSVDDNRIKKYEHKYFHNHQRIGDGAFAKVYRVNWKNSEQYLALKSFFGYGNDTAKEIVHEV